MLAGAGVLCAPRHRPSFAGLRFCIPRGSMAWTLKAKMAATL